MRIHLIRWIILSCAICQGCAPLKNVARTAVVEPAHYALNLSNRRERCRNRKLAETAWKTFQQTCPDANSSPDFAKGFKEGFADYLYEGGTGIPPPVPPRRYWRTKYESPQGHQAMTDWFEGFRQGASYAWQSGYRELVTVLPSVSLAGEGALHSSAGSTPSSTNGQMFPSDHIPVPPGTETLPVPRPVLQPNSAEGLDDHKAIR